MADTGSSDVAELLKDIDSGEFIDRASRQMKELVAKLKECERNLGGVPKGKFVISVDFKLEKGILDIRASTKVTEPSSVTGRTMRYGSEDGLLLKEDPRQHVLALERGTQRSRE